MPLWPLPIFRIVPAHAVAWLYQLGAQLHFYLLMSEQTWRFQIPRDSRLAQN